MNNPSLRELITSLWSVYGSGPFSEAVIYDRLSKDGGLDAKDLTIDIVVNLFDAHISDWHVPVFTCSELVAYYLAVGKNLSGDQLVAAVFAVCVLADAARFDAEIWECEVKKTIYLSNYLVDRLDCNEMTLFLCYVFGKGGQAP